MMRLMERFSSSKICDFAWGSLAIQGIAPSTCWETSSRAAGFLEGQ